MIAHLLRIVPLLVLLVAAAATDVRSRKIPNWLTLLLILGGLARGAFAARGPGLAMSVAGLFAAALLPFLLYAIGAMGAGDVKLMAGVGAWMGPIGGVAVFLLACVVAMTMALAQAAAQRRIPALLGSSALTALNLLHTRQIEATQGSGVGRSASLVGRPLPFAVAALISTVMALLWGRLVG